MTWRAQAHLAPGFDGVEVIWGDIGRGRSDFVKEIDGNRTVLVTLNDGDEIPKLMLPGYYGREAIEALRDAFNEFLGKPQDSYRERYEEAREALLHERARVDKVLEARNA